MEHQLKIAPDYYNRIAAGTKTAEARYDDRGYHVGDSLLLREWLAPTNQTTDHYTGREMRVTVTDVTEVEPWVGAGFVTLSIKLPTTVSVEASKLAALELIAKQAAKVVMSVGRKPFKGCYQVEEDELDELRRLMRGRGLGVDE